jgi:hypothetical protein
MAAQIVDVAARAQIERLVRSEALRNSDTLQRLLRYLGEKSLVAGGEPLKEYAIGIDVFGKKSEYDPRQDSGVRIHVGRLRQKLAEYYATEGLNDQVVISLPKGHFKLHFEERSEHVAPISAIPAAEADAPLVGPIRAPWRIAVLLLAAALALTVGWGIWSSVKLRRLQQEESLTTLTPPLQEFWAPFVGPTRPLLIVIRTPLFAGLQGKGAYRERYKNRWGDMVQSANVKSLEQALGEPDVFPLYSYAGFGEAKSAALLGMMLGRHTPNIHLVRSSDVSWQEISESNVVFLGSSTTITELLQSLPVLPQINLEPNGLRILSSKAGGPSFIRDDMAGDSASGYSSFLPDDGVAHAVISILPGPNGKTVVGNFAANLNAGLLAAVEYITDPTRLEQLNEKLRDVSGHIPQYFQVALEVTFKGGVPVSSRYLLHREVRFDSRGLP